MKIYKVSLVFIFNSKDNPKLMNTDDAINLAIQEIDETPISDLYFEAEIIESDPDIGKKLINLYKTIKK